MKPRGRAESKGSWLDPAHRNQTFSLAWVGENVSAHLTEQSTRRRKSIIVLRKVSLLSRKKYPSHLDDETKSIIPRLHNEEKYHPRLDGNTKSIIIIAAIALKSITQGHLETRIRLSATCLFSAVSSQDR